MPTRQYDLIIYRKLTNPYTRYVEVGTGRIWDVANSALSATPTYGDTDVQHTADNTYIGGTPVKIPAGLPAGNFDMLVYDSAAIAVTDVVVVGKRIGVLNNVAETNARLTGLPIAL